MVLEEQGLKDGSQSLYVIHRVVIVFYLYNMTRGTGGGREVTRRRLTRERMEKTFPMALQWR